MIRKILLASVAIITLYSCSNTNNHKSDDPSKIVLEDTQGNRVELKDVAQKVVCIFDPSIDVIYMLQQQNKLVGISAELYYDKELYDYFKLMDSRIEKKQIPTPGSTDVANIESIVALRPDLVIAQQLSPNLIKMLNDMGIAVYLSSSDTDQHLIKEMTDIAKMLGATERGDELVAYAKEEATKIAQQSKEESTASKKTVYFSWANGRIFSTTGRNSMMNNCLELADVENICTSTLDKMNINPETLIKWNPDMIVMWNDSPQLFYDKKELQTITAIEKKQIYNLMPMFFYNPHTFKSLCAALRINNWAYGKDKDTKKEIEDIIIKLYGDENGKKLIEFI